MDFQQKRLSDLNALYIEHAGHIDSVQAGLRRELPLLVQEFELSLDQTAAQDAYIEDRVTIFRFLRKNNYSLPHTLSLLVDTIKWRIRESVDSLTLSNIDSLFFDEPFCFFRGHDRCGRPILVVQLSHLPATLNNENDKIAFLFPFTTFVLETVRKITWETTLERMKEGMENPVLTDIIVLVDFKNARSLPRDAKLMQAFIQLLRRYPLSAGTVCLLNFGWMYQGLWQMVKLLLTEEAKNRVCFPRVKELCEWIDQEELLSGNDAAYLKWDFKELGVLLIDDDKLESKKPVSWDLSQDTVYNCHTTTPMPPLSPAILSRRNSTSTIYYDTHDSLSRSASSTHLAHRFPYQRRLSTASSCYATPVGGMTPIPSHSNLVALATKPPRMRSAFKSLLDPNDGVSSWLLSEKLTALQEQQNEGQSSLTPSERRNSSSSSSGRLHDRQRRRDVAVEVVLSVLVRAERLVRMMVIRMLKKAVRYRNTVYWIAACVLLRDGVQEFMQQFLSLMGELLVDRLSLGISDASTAGIRSIFSLTTGHRGQLTL
ncbi:hypothetical protein BDB00DRAFT_785271 [Zychaea mexicana]|uniref:uncharacterized protein n=1 Tax=Zychaea mexicana TaxID=64656 RepID=UPI0022FDFF4F|nr:uncharacterized protein BDB00DRAFT_785271 [Zychaea mexicana]KAI9496831.1 hypothetical protein BDB00DRAFT_785271 [Zychaea mexicana]